MRPLLHDVVRGLGVRFSVVERIILLSSHVQETSNFLRFSPVFRHQSPIFTRFASSGIRPWFSRLIGWRDKGLQPSAVLYRFDSQRPCGQEVAANVVTVRGLFLSRTNVRTCWG